MVTAIVATDLKANLKHFMDIAVEGNCVVITRPKRRNAVLISEDEYNELQRIKQNAEYTQKLKDSLIQLENGQVVEKSLEELESMADE
ncbi:MAG: type II toxin-antitoxin system Phd/YefM family antitoxin [Clostridiales bacterium]|nr:type II toxin-antitoxin system Phd/YefM family antitoxin [Clostridiales bacterium]